MSTKLSGELFKRVAFGRSGLGFAFRPRRPLFYCQFSTASRFHI